MQAIGLYLVEADGFCDCIPGISTISNLIDLFGKCVYKYLPESIQNSHYWTHIHNKDLFRCAVLLVPILGNLYVGYNDNERSLNEHRATEARMIQRLEDLTIQYFNLVNRLLINAQPTQAPGPLATPFIEGRSYGINAIGSFQ